MPAKHRVTFYSRMSALSASQTAPETHGSSCRQIQGSLPCAKRTAEIMRLLLTTQRHPDAATLIDDVRAVGYKLQAAKPVGEFGNGFVCQRAANMDSGVHPPLMLGLCNT